MCKRICYGGNASHCIICIMHDTARRICYFRQLAAGIKRIRSHIAVSIGPCRVVASCVIDITVLCSQRVCLFLQISLLIIGKMILISHIIRNKSKLSHGIIFHPLLIASAVCHRCPVSVVIIGKNHCAVRILHLDQVSCG